MTDNIIEPDPEEEGWPDVKTDPIEDPEAEAPSGVEP